MRVYVCVHQPDCVLLFFLPLVRDIDGSVISEESVSGRRGRGAAGWRDDVRPAPRPAGVRGRSDGVSQGGKKK